MGREDRGVAPLRQWQAGRKPEIPASSPLGGGERLPGRMQLRPS
jgi:hypothetical protein